MGERKGQNFYYPPDFNYKTHKSLNGYHGTHALRERAKKIDQGILVIRFEMPFNIWCLGCHNHVGMGVRYNAEKKKCGMYYTTPLYEFRMKCHLCDNYYVIRTDPKNFDYELVEGCSRQELRFDPTDIAQIGAVDRGFTQKLAADAMFKKEHEAEDKEKAVGEEGRVDKLEWIQERMRDDFAANSFLRAQFRNEKKNLNETRARDANLREKLSIGTTNLLPESEEDRRIASMMTRYRDSKSHDDHLESSRDRIESRRIFGKAEDPDTPSTSSGSSGAPLSSSERLKATLKAERAKRINATFSSTPGEFLGIKRKSTTSLGIQKKKAVVPDEVVKEAPPPANPISLIAQQYGNSSDDSD
uniref:Coiled-coil domain-containing protein 130 n=1 Tax=Caenorhabditis tropicalis TaxID=1561998 RepID=A0A1I7UFK1_9PELO